MNRLLQGKRGVTLVEVVISIAIVAIVSVALLATITQSLVISRQADEVYTSSILAQRRIDVLKKFSFSDILNAAPETDTLIDEDGDGDNDYARTTEVEVDFDDYSYLIKVKVSVDRLVGGIKSGNPVIIETLFVDLS
ncbi:MAG: type II secretion system protein [Candidatus Omnitrophota bacterium]